MNQSIVTIAKNLINLVYPLHCEVCKKSLDPLDALGVCEFCKGEIKKNPKPYCKACGRSIENANSKCTECQRRLFHFDSARSACLYEGALKKLIGLFKYKRKISLANILTKLMVDFVKDDVKILDGADLMTFVPLRANRLRERGFNQSKVLALGLSEEFEVPLVDSLKKVCSTKPQNELARDERLTNLRGAFEAEGEGIELEGCDILLLDDVMTTGATLDECAKALKEAGAKRIRCLTLARGA